MATNFCDHSQENDFLIIIYYQYYYKKSRKRACFTSLNCFGLNPTIENNAFRQTVSSNTPSPQNCAIADLESSTITSKKFKTDAAD